MEPRRPLRGSGLRIADLLDALAANVPDMENRLVDVFGWRFERSSARTRLLLGGTAGTLFAGLLIAAFTQGLRLDQLITWLATIVLLVVPAVVLMWRDRRHASEFLEALALLDELRPLAPLIRIYLRG